MFILYSVLSFLGFVILLPYFLAQAMRHGKYWESLFERCGKIPAHLRQTTRGAVWIHAVSVGECNAVIPLVAQLRQRLSDHKVLLSTTTLTGQQFARERIVGADGFFYYPFDWRWNVRRSLKHIRPSIVCLAETELWPNFIDEAHRQGVKLVVVNGRISEKSLHWYARVRGFLSRFLQEVDLFLMQTEEDAERIRYLGAPVSRVLVSGNLKYDVDLGRHDGKYRDLIRTRFLGMTHAPILIAGSTAEGEEEQVVAAFAEVQRRFPEARLILAPRRPERFETVASWLKERSLRFVRRTQLEREETGACGILLVDTVGELSSLYSLADVAFVGGSLVKKGGHNILEPAVAAVPVLFGPHMANFAKMAEDFLEHGAAMRVRDARELASAAVALFENPDRAKEIGECGRALVARSAGATARTVEKIVKLL